MGSTDHSTPQIAVWAGPRGRYHAVCDCGWDDKPRRFRFLAVDRAWRHHIAENHDLAEPLVVDLPFALDMNPWRFNAKRIFTSWPATVVMLFIPAIVALLTAFPAAASPADDGYIATLDHFGVYYSSESAAITVGYSICNGIDGGMSVGRVVRMGMDYGGYSATDAGYILGAAVGSYCPDHADLIKGSAVMA